MRTLLVFVFGILSSTLLRSQVGLGVIQVDVQTTFQIDLFAKLSDTIPAKQLNFGFDEESYTMDLANRDSVDTWFHPEAYFPDYDIFLLRCMDTLSGRYLIEVDSGTHAQYWIPAAATYTFRSWKDFLENVLTIERSNPQPIYTVPDEKASTLKYDGQDCFSVKQVQGAWMEITTFGPCLENEWTDSTLASGWIKWHDGHTLLINYYLIY
ncbi:MAG: hypothetical protein R2794_00265 [Chitinophagales bacterium]